MIDSAYFDPVKKTAYGLSMGSMWKHLTIEMRERSDYSGLQLEHFLSIIRRLVIEGDVRLAKDDVYLSGTIDDQLDLLKKSWPNNPGEDDLEGIGLWFLVDAPAGFVWQGLNGVQVWT